MKPQDKAGKEIKHTQSSKIHRCEKSNAPVQTGSGLFDLCFCVQEPSGEKTNNGIHYKLQLLYSNGGFARFTAQRLLVALNTELKPKEE